MGSGASARCPRTPCCRLWGGGEAQTPDPARGTSQAPEGSPPRRHIWTRSPRPFALGTRTAVLLSRPPPSRDLPTAGLPEDSLSSPVTRGCREVAPPWSGGVMVIIWAVNSSSKYLVSVSDVTWGLKGGLSCGGNGRFQAALRAPHPAPTAAPGPSPPRSAPCAPRSVSGLPRPSSTHSSREETRGAGPPAPRKERMSRFSPLAFFNTGVGADGCCSHPFLAKPTRPNCPWLPLG